MKTTAFLLAALLLGAPAFAATLSSTPDYAHPVSVHGTLAYDGSWEQLLEQSYGIPYGLAYSPVYSLNAPIQVDAVRTEIFTQPGYLCGASLYSIDVTTSPTQTVMSRYFPDATGLVDLPDTPLYKVLFILNEPLLRGGECVVRFSVLPHGGGTDGPTGDFALAGVVHYTGGFVSKQPMAVSNTQKIVKVWARVPTFCQGLDVLEVGTVTEGQYDVAKVADATKNIYAVNDGAGSRASAVELSLNGPTTLTCDIPVYLQTKAD